VVLNTCQGPYDPPIKILLAMLSLLFGPYDRRLYTYPRHATPVVREDVTLGPPCSRKRVFRRDPTPDSRLLFSSPPHVLGLVE
jgi:hypothetical protein